MILDRVGVASLAQAVLEVGAEVGKELLRERTGPSGDGLMTDMWTDFLREKVRTLVVKTDGEI